LPADCGISSGSTGAGLKDFGGRLPILKGTTELPEHLDKDLRANLLPGVTIVPAMVIAIDKAQEAGIKYNRQ
jgi:hypothetical protein